MSRDDSRVVFVGNIPYDGSEQQLAEQFSEVMHPNGASVSVDIRLSGDEQVGTVVSFRLVNDRETGKPKGFGFCEYKDAETARSAIRNLNGIMFHGRSLRVDTADDEQGSGSGGGGGGGGGARSMMGSSAPAFSSASSSSAPMAVVDGLSNEQHVEILAQMKQLIETDADGARRLLHENQQLAQAMLRILILFDAVKPADIQSLSVPIIAPEAPAPLSMAPPTSQFDQRAPAASHMGPSPMQPPMHHTMPQPPMPHGRPKLQPDQAQLLQKLMSLTPEQLADLPQAMQDRVRVLRQRMGAQGSRDTGPRGAPPPSSYRSGHRPY